MSQSEEDALDEILSEKKPLKFEPGGIYGIEYPYHLTAEQRDFLQGQFKQFHEAHGVTLLLIEGGAKFATT